MLPGSGASLSCRTKVRTGVMRPCTVVPMRRRAPHGQAPGARATAGRPTPRCQGFGPGDRPAPHCRGIRRAFPRPAARAEDRGTARHEVLPPRRSAAGRAANAPAAGPAGTVAERTSLAFNPEATPETFLHRRAAARPAPKAPSAGHRRHPEGGVGRYNTGRERRREQRSRVLGHPTSTPTALRLPTTSPCSLQRRQGTRPGHRAIGQATRAKWSGALERFRGLQAGQRAARHAHHHERQGRAHRLGETQPRRRVHGRTTALQAADQADGDRVHGTDPAGRRGHVEAQFAQDGGTGRRRGSCRCPSS